MARQFVTMTLRRHLVAWEQAIAKQMLTADEKRLYFAEHQVEGLLRGDSVNRADFYAKGIQSGWMLPSEARSFENWRPVDGIDDVVDTAMSIDDGKSKKGVVPEFCKFIEVRGIVFS
jgi:phage portal protein BeeE